MEVEARCWCSGCFDGFVGITDDVGGNVSFDSTRSDTNTGFIMPVEVVAVVLAKVLTTFVAFKLLLLLLDPNANDPLDW